MQNLYSGTSELRPPTGLLTSGLNVPVVLLMRILNTESVVTVVPFHKATLGAAKCCTLERCFLVRGRTKCICSSSGKHSH